MSISGNDDNPRRRWFRFSLRTLVAAVSAIGLLLGWLGANWRVVAARTSALDEIESPSPPEAMIYYEHDDTAKAQVVSRVRRLLGAVAVRRILLVGRTFPAGRRQRIRALFPEATVVYLPQAPVIERAAVEIALPPALSSAEEVRQTQSQFPESKVIPFGRAPNDR
jgi:hypothetical protein